MSRRERFSRVGQTFRRRLEFEPKGLVFLVVNSERAGGQGAGQPRSSETWAHACLTLHVAEDSHDFPTGQLVELFESCDGDLMSWDDPTDMDERIDDVGG